MILDNRRSMRVVRAQRELWRTLLWLAAFELGCGFFLK
jgi:hypothetical protein